MNNSHRAWISTTVVLSVYLFVTAPPPLSEASTSTQAFPIESVLKILNRENQHVRALYTKQIVLAGKKIGLKFDENWRDKDIDAGPLPAQFLRLSASSLERSKIPLGLYLGSDYPINSANKFSHQQEAYFKRIKIDRQPAFFYVEDINRYTYMFADIAISKACIKCHNDHKDTTKKDWKLDDVMGATTWTYPDGYISYEQAVNMIRELRNSFKYAYGSYLEKVEHLKQKPEIGDKWPRDGYYLPSVETFMKRVSDIASTETLSALTFQLASKSTTKQQVN